ncbi:5-methylcytosine-specific restriction enzyme B [Streptococcus cristatus]|uniref:5-methylcytosine-specific restriction enzyme B n=1 Tax=Streptococcus cristatus TaxID=45634 RepID=A0A3R9MHW8_STRCR|nr:AAA family ATPase [Streptococcus cristatus]RSJ76787.1 5-methylcytosine-specific restriction enzyme B [Streptococcus cristatus]
MDTEGIIEDLKKEFRNLLKDKGIKISDKKSKIGKYKRDQTYYISVSREKLKYDVPFIRFASFTPKAREGFPESSNYIVVIFFNTKIDFSSTYMIVPTAHLDQFDNNIKQQKSGFCFENTSGKSYFFSMTDENKTKNLNDIKQFLRNLNNLDNGEEEKNMSENEQIITYNHEKCLSSLNTILYGPPGTGKTYNSIKYAVDTIDDKYSQDGTKTYSDYVKKFNQLKADGQIAFTTFHQSYGYEEFIEGIKPFLGKRGLRRGRSDLNYKISDGVFKEFCNKAASDESNKYVFIIDEINRGNISKIFGELITLIEDSKRSEKEEEMSVTLPYSQEEFSVPKNVYILGTMNTADRSIALMDTALRRRFEFIEMMPDIRLLKDVIVKDNKDSKDNKNNKEIDIQKMLEKMNQRIEVLYDREHTLGHAFFMPLKNEKKATIDQLASIFKNKILPLLQEYFYEDYEKIMLVLGIDTQNKETKKFISVKSNGDLFKNSPDIDLNPTYQINEEAFQTPDNYMTIYGGASNEEAADETKDSDS